MPSVRISNKNILSVSLASNISPSPHGIKIHEIDHPDGKLFLIDVPQSITPPHQVNREGRYYIRLETEARAAPHGFVEALFFKRQKPDLNLTLKVSFSKRTLEEFSIELSFENNSLYTAENVGYILKVEGITRFLYKSDLWSVLPVENGQIVYKDMPLDN